MIPEIHIDAWRREAPWIANYMVEQDLMICRAVVEIFSEPGLASALAFRGGTALHKIHLAPPARYSEDIDLVQVADGSIGPVFDALRGRLEPWLGKPRRDFGPGVVTLTFKAVSEGQPPQPLRLKIEINSREHFTDYMMLEYLLVRPSDRENIFANHRCRYLVLDEVHTYRGLLGSNIALLMIGVGVKAPSETGAE
jgi:hypothetical protein